MTKTVTVSVGGARLVVDVEAWAREYGTDTTAAAVRADVKAYYTAEIMASYPVESGIVQSAVRT